MSTRAVRMRRAGLLVGTLAAGATLSACTTSSDVCVNDRCTIKADGPATVTIDDDGDTGSVGSDELEVAVDGLRDGAVEVDVAGQRRTLRLDETSTFDRARVTVVKATADGVELRVVR